MIGKRFVWTLVLLAAALVAAPAAGETKTWVGGDWGMWEEGPNWSPTGAPTATSDVTINAGAGEVCVGLWFPYTPEAYQEARTLNTISTPEGEVCLERWTGDWVYMHVHDGVLNQGRLCLEEFELETTTITNQGYLDLDTMEVVADIENYGAMITWATDIEGDVTCHEDSVYQVEGWAEIALRDDDTGGNFDNHGEVWLGGHASIEVDGTLHNHAAGHITGGSGAIRAWGGLVNDGLLNSWGMDLGIHCPGSTFTNTGQVYNTSGSTVSVMADAVVQQGVVTVYPDGAVNFACDLVNQAGATINLLGGTLSARNLTHEAGAILEGFGHIAVHDQFGNFWTLTNQGTMEFYADIRIVGHLDNQTGATLGIRNGDLTVVGDITNNGDINTVNASVYWEGTYTGAGTLTFAGDEVKAANGVMTIAPGGTLNVTGTGRTDLYADIDCGGTVIVASGAAAVFRGDLSGAMESLTIAGGATPTGTLDLTVNNMIVDYATTNSYDAIEAFVTSGIGNTTTRPWDGPGINSGDADATLFALGILDNANPPTVVAPFNDTTRLFEGEGVDSTSVLVKYTYYGDANLDGVVSPLDVQRLILSWNGQTEGDPRWAVGDFNYDNLISPFDVQLLILGWNGQGGALAGGSPACPLGFSARAGGGMPAPTPEPATLALLGLGAAAMVGCRRRRNRQ